MPAQGGHDGAVETPKELWKPLKSLEGARGFSFGHKFADKSPD